MWGYLDEDIKNIVRDFEWRTRQWRIIEINVIIVFARPARLQKLMAARQAVEIVKIVI